MKAVNGRMAGTFLGTLRVAHTRLVSLALTVIEKMLEDSAQAGTSAPGPRRTMASCSGYWLMVQARWAPARVTAPARSC
jgi:hypothetical protein